MSYKYELHNTDTINNAAKQYDNIINNSPVYNSSDTTTAAQKAMDNAQNKWSSDAADGYKSEYSNQINDLSDKYTNNEFDFDVNNSSDYQQYSDKYKREGAKAQENTQASYSANTGGYNNSYAQAAGMKTFNGYMDELTSKIPTLKSNAYQSYSQQQEATKDKISVLQGLDDVERQKYNDKLDSDYNFANYYLQKYQTSSGLDMNNFENELNSWSSKLSAASTNLSTERSLAENQYEHNTVSADTQASINSSASQNNASIAAQKAQSDAYYQYLYGKMK